MTSLGKLPAGSRLAKWLTGIGLLGVTLTLDVMSAHAATPAPAGSTGYDISWPQCPSSFPADGSFAIVGVTDGLAFSANPCLKGEYTWASGLSYAAELYMNTGNPETASSNWAGRAGTGPRPCSSTDLADPSNVNCAYNYGWNAAADAVNVANGSVGSAATTASWWLDVEIANSWNGTTAANSSTVQGYVDYLYSHGTGRVGIYSTAALWGQITGGYTVPSSATGPPFDWLAGASSATQAASLCKSANSFSGGPVQLVQYPHNGFDSDYVCDVPPAPTGLVANALSTTQIGLSWTASSGATTYKIQRSPDGTGWTQVGTSTTTSFTDSGLTASAKYFYRVIANNGSQDSVPSNVASATTAPPAPTYAVGAVGTDNGLWALRGGSKWASLGGVLLGAPAVVAIPQTSGPAVPLYIATGSDHTLYVRNDSQGWRSFSPAPSYCIDNPAAVVIGGTLYVACEGGDHALWHAETPAPSGTNLPTLSVSSWQSLGGSLGAGPAVASVAGTPTYFVIGTDQHIYSRDLTSGFVRYAWACVGHPALATYGATSYFACHGTDNALWYATNSGRGWSAAQWLGGVLIDGVGLAATSSGPIFFVEGTDHAVYQRTITTGWTSDGGIIHLGLAACTL